MGRIVWKDSPTILQALGEVREDFGDKGDGLFRFHRLAGYGSGLSCDCHLHRGSRFQGDCVSPLFLNRFKVTVYDWHGGPPAQLLCRIATSIIDLERCFIDKNLKPALLVDLFNKLFTFFLLQLFFKDSLNIVF